jgi:hypothetical protein
MYSSPVCDLRNFTTPRFEGFKNAVLFPYESVEAPKGLALLTTAGGSPETYVSLSVFSLVTWLKNKIEA